MGYRAENLCRRGTWDVTRAQLADGRLIETGLTSAAELNRARQRPI
jgi:hypothetical protein